MLRSAGWDAPAGTPAPVVDILTNAIKKVITAPDFVKKAADQGMTITYKGPKEYDDLWGQAEKDIQAVLQAVGKAK